MFRMSLILGSFLLGLSGCGGGGGDSGGPGVLSLSIDESTWTYPDAGCVGPTPFTTVYIYGGVAPFSVQDPFAGSPGILQFNTAGLSNRSFEFSHLAGCVAVPIAVKDAAGNTVTIDFEAKYEAPTTP